MLVDIMVNQYGVPLDEARQVCCSFLKSFRRCPGNGEVDLDEWRLALWVDALGNKYANIAAEVYMQWVELRYRYLSLSPDVTDLLSALRHRYLLALVTNGPSNAQWEKVRRLELCDYFDAILVSGDLPWEKPNCNIFLEACHCLGVKPQNCLMVGDKLETDIQGGVNACLGGTVWVVPSYGTTDAKNTSLLADFTLDTVTGLVDILPLHTVPDTSYSEMPPWKSDSCPHHKHKKCQNIINNS